MTDDLAPILQEIEDEVAAAEAADLIERCLHLRLSGVLRWDAIARRLNKTVPEDEQVSPETVQACLESKAFVDAYRQARQDPEGWIQKRLRSARAIHKTLNEVDALSDETNDDKRTRTANLQFRLGIAGITPQTQVKVGPDADFMTLVERALTARKEQGE